MDEQIRFQPAYYDTQGRLRAPGNATRICSQTSGHISSLRAEGALQQGIAGKVSAQWGYNHELSSISLLWLFNHMYRCIHCLLNSLTSEEIYHTYVRLPSPISAKIHNSSRFSQYFGDCIGALDGTHIPAHIPEARHTVYHNRKNQLSQNVLAACNFDLKFVYVLPGWEGSTVDSHVFENAGANGFVIPEGRYYLGDRGYAKSTLLLVPYRSTHYHLKKWGQGKHRYARIIVRW